MNILLKETEEKFGYHVNDLKPSSEKLVVCSCDICGEIKEISFRGAKKRSCCRNCSNKINSNTNKESRIQKLKLYYEKNGSPLKGIPRPEHVKKALLESHLGKEVSKETREKISKSSSGVKNGFFGKKHTEKTIETIRFNAKKNAKRGKESNFYGKIYHGKGMWYHKGDKKYFMRSSWEYKYAKYLDDNNINWEHESKFFEITLNGKQATYTPDFYLEGENVYVEIKGYWRDDAKEKFDCFVNQYPNIKIILLMRDELKNIGIKL